MKIIRSIKDTNSVSPKRSDRNKKRKSKNQKEMEKVKAEAKRRK